MEPKPDESRKCAPPISNQFAGNRVFYQCAQRDRSPAGEFSCASEIEHTHHRAIAAMRKTVVPRMRVAMESLCRKNTREEELEHCASNLFAQFVGPLARRRKRFAFDPRHRQNRSMAELFDALRHNHTRKLFRKRAKRSQGFRFAAKIEFFAQHRAHFSSVARQI